MGKIFVGDTSLSEKFLWMEANHENNEIKLTTKIFTYTVRLLVPSFLHCYFLYQCDSKVLYTGKFWWGKILVNHTGKSYWQGKFWQISYSQCICQIHFWCFCEYWQGKWRIAHNSPNSPIFPLAKIFPYMVLPSSE